MRLHRLRMTAIGPFGGHVELDLASYGNSGLFLIEGPTGSGKSTVLDSISFALYGKLAQSSAVIERMKSHHAPAGTEPVVELVFETQSGLYRIRRTPSYERPKKRGTGSLNTNMTVKLWRLTSTADLDGGELLSNNLGDAEDEVTRALGLTHAQFVQTVLLPQGEFASFLRADTSTKRALLQRLFGTELLAGTQQQLIDGRRAAEDARAGALADIRRAGHALAGALELGDEQVAELLGLAEAGDRTALAQSLQSVQAGLRATDSELAGRHATATEARTTAEVAVRQGQDLLRHKDVRDRLQVEQQELAATAEQVRTAGDELAAAERALSVVPAAEALTSATSRSDEAQDFQSRARDRLPEALYGADESRLREVAAGYRTTIGELAQELRREQQLIQLKLRHEQLSAEHDELLTLTARAREQLGLLPQQRVVLIEAGQQSRLAGEQIAGLQAERDRAQNRLFAAGQAQQAARAAADNQQFARELFEAAEGQRARLETLQASWRANIASELGLALQLGDPCAVCGSIEHPKPARPSKGHVSQDQVRSAEDEVRRLTNDVEARRTLLAEQQSELIRLQLASDQLSPELAEDKLDRAEAVLATARTNAAELPALRTRLAELEDRIEALTSEIQRSEIAETRLAEQARALQDTIEQDELAVHQARFGYPSVAERLSDLKHETTLVETAAGASATATSAIRGALEAGTAFNAALVAAGFDQRSWQAARRSNSLLAGQRARIREHTERTVAVQARLSTAELSDPALDGPMPDLPVLRAKAEHAGLDEQRTAREHGAATQRLAAAAKHAGLLNRAADKSAQVLLRTAPAIRVGNLVAGLGENQLKMELTTYVLVRRFAEIVAAANSQLRQISSGRYQLEHTDARSGNARSGLGLRVLDLHTGRPRDPGTLSGGETFYVSLALALGLADIVRAESGGIDLGTLFIDEGFGTLDAEVLDQVIAVLDGLRSGGRAVGIVSHVSELKMRIADRIQVRRSVDGSSTVLSTN